MNYATSFSGLISLRLYLFPDEYLTGRGAIRPTKCLLIEIDAY